MELNELCLARGLSAKVKSGTSLGVLDDWQKTARQFTVTLALRGSGRSLTVPFFQGIAHTEDPSACDVLGCLLMDASAYDNSRGFSDFCQEFGYDEDSRKALREYRACGRTSERLRRFLGDAFEGFINADR